MALPRPLSSLINCAVVMASPSAYENAAVRPFVVFTLHHLPSSNTSARQSASGSVHLATPLERARVRVHRLPMYARALFEHSLWRCPSRALAPPFIARACANACACTCECAAVGAAPAGVVALRRWGFCVCASNFLGESMKSCAHTHSLNQTINQSTFQ